MIRNSIYSRPGAICGRYRAANPTSMYVGPNCMYVLITLYYLCEISSKNPWTVIRIFPQLLARSAARSIFYELLGLPLPARSAGSTWRSGNSSSVMSLAALKIQIDVAVSSITSLKGLAIGYRYPGTSRLAIASCIRKYSFHFEADQFHGSGTAS